MQRPYFETAVLALPKNGALYVPIELDFTEFTNGGAPEFDLEAELMQIGGIGFVQGMFIDNGQNNNTLTLTFYNGANQGFPLRIPAKVQTWQPLLIPVGTARFTASCVVAADRKVQVQLVNFPVMPIMWNSASDVMVKPKASR